MLYRCIDIDILYSTGKLFACTEILKGRFGGERECAELMNSGFTQVLSTILDPRTFCARSCSKEKRAGVKNACDRSRFRLHSPMSAYFSSGPYEALG